MITLARLRTSILHWGNKYDGPNTYKDGRRGALDDAFWDEDELVDVPSKRAKKKRKREPGCPQNDGKSHVYVWNKVEHIYWPWNGKGPRRYTFEEYVCCGCGKRGRKHSRNWNFQ